jgi:hypothetical protein
MIVEVAISRRDVLREAGVLDRLRQPGRDHVVKPLDICGEHQIR